MSSIGANRWLTTQLWRCGQCSKLSRQVEGYRPISNPMLYDSYRQNNHHHSARAVAVGDRGMFMKKCDGCAAVHNKWTFTDFQSALDEKFEAAAKANTSRKTTASATEE
jgi:hypothetical protein